MRQLLVLDSKYRTNPEEKEHEYKFKLNTKMKINGIIRLEQFVSRIHSMFLTQRRKAINLYIQQEEYLLI